MPFAELAASIGFFLISMLVAVYLVRYSNHQITDCIVALEDKHNELVDLNGKLAKQIFHSDKNIRDEHNALHAHTKKGSAQ